MRGVPRRGRLRRESVVADVLSCEARSHSFSHVFIFLAQEPEKPRECHDLCFLLKKKKKGCRQPRITLFLIGCLFMLLEGSGKTTS